MSFLARMIVNTLKGKAVQKVQKSFVEGGGIKGLKEKAADTVVQVKSTMGEVVDAVKEKDLEKGTKAATAIGQGVGSTVKSAANFAVGTVTDIVTDTTTTAKQLQSGTKEFFNDVSEKSEKLKSEKANDNTVSKEQEKTIVKTPKTPGQ